MEWKALIGTAVAIFFVDLWLYIVKTWLHVYLEIENQMATNISDLYARGTVST